MPRYSPSKNPESRQKGQNLRRSTRIASPRSNPNHKPLWRNPIVWLGIIACFGILVFPVWQDSKNVKVISIHATDASDSGIANPEIPKGICKARAEKLIAGDLAMNFDYSDRPEPTYSQTIDQTTDLSQQCQTLFTNGKERPSQISKQEGTDPVSLITRIQNAVIAERTKGDRKPVVVTIWLDAAEPIPGKPAYDFDDFQKRVESIVRDRGKVAIIGTTGELRENLEKRFAKNSAIYLCTAKDSANCIRDTFDAARMSKK